MFADEARRTFGGAALARLGLGLVLAGMACGSPVARIDVEDCAAAYEAGRHARAIELCEWEHAREGAQEAGVLAMRAHLILGHEEEVLRWSATLRSTEHAGVAWAYAGLVHERRKDCEPQIEAFEHARLAYEARGEHLKAARAARGRMRCHWLQTDLRPAFETFGLATEHARQADAAGFEARLALDLFTLLYDAGDLAAARWALDRVEATSPPEDVGMRAERWLAEGNLRIREGQPALARIAYHDSVRLALSAGDPDTARLGRINLVELALAEGDASTAAMLLERVEAEAVDLLRENRRLRTTLRHHGAWLAVEQGRSSEALALIRAALEEDPPTEWRWKLERLRGRAHVREGDHAAARQAFRASIEAIESMREAVGYEVFKEGMLDQRREPYEALFSLEAEAGDMEGALAIAERARARAFLDAITTKREPVADLDIERSAARFDDLRALLQRGGITGQAQPRAWTEMRPGLHRVDALVYMRAQERLWVFALREGALRLERLPLPMSEIERRISDWHAELEDPQRARAVAEAILPVHLLPPPGGTLWIIADAAITRVPFAGLDHGRVLVEDHVIAYAPSVDVLSRRFESGSSVGRGPGGVVLGDAGQDLPHAAAEATMVAARLGVAERVGGQADRASLWASADAPLLHMAVHGGIDARGAWLELAGGRVHAFDILARGIRPRTVVLAGCATAASAERGSWGSVASSFLAAGSEAVVAAMWSVPDGPTRRFVEALYREGVPSDPARALAHAQRSFLAAGEPLSTWGAFVVLGSPPPLFDDEEGPR